MIGKSFSVFTSFAKLKAFETFKYLFLIFIDYYMIFD